MRLHVIASRVAGASMQMIKDLNLDEGGVVLMVQAADDELRKKGYRYPEGPEIVWEALARAADKAVPGILEKIPDWAKPKGVSTPEALVHEMEHHVLDPAFDLISGDKPGNHPVEAAMDEAFAAGMQDYKTSITEAAYEPSEKFLRGDCKTVGEMVDYISNAPISKKEKEQIRNSVAWRMKKTFDKYRDKPLSEKANMKLSENCREGAPWVTQISAMFLDGVVGKYEHWKGILAEGMEDVWRKFVLHAKNELRKAVKTAPPKPVPPKGVKKPSA